jgi:hypothetical protein
MTDSIDKHLQGTVVRAALTPGERARADLVEHVIEETRAFVEARPVPDLSTAVMCHIEQLRARSAHRSQGVLGRLARSLWTPREVSFSFRLAYGLLAAAVLTLFIFAPHEWRPPGDKASRASEATETRLFVQFRLEARDVSTVRLAGSFTNWQAEHELYQANPGIWTITLALPPGVHDYAFVVDGDRWLADPYAPTVDDGFGGTNSRIALVPPAESSRL